MNCGSVVDTPRGMATVIEVDEKRGQVRVLLNEDIGRRDGRSYWLRLDEVIEVFPKWKGMEE